MELCRAKLESVLRNNDSIQVHNQRFRSVFKELMHALQSEYRKGIQRKLSLQMEEKVAIRISLMNLREEISTQVRPLKPTSLNKAFQEALEASVWCRERAKTRSFAKTRQQPLTSDRFNRLPVRLPSQTLLQQILNKQKILYGKR